MAHTNNDSFEWSLFWSLWRKQPIKTQHLWMAGKGGASGTLQEILADFMLNFPKKVQDEVFEFAPKDVQIYFKYKSAPKAHRDIHSSAFLSEFLTFKESQ